LPQPEGTDDFNARYFAYAAEHSGEDVEALVARVRHTPRPYSTDLAAAWLVVEHLHARVFAHGAGDAPAPWPHPNYLVLTCLGVSTPGAQHSGWAAAFTAVEWGGHGDDWFEDPEHYGGAHGDTAPLAICRAALATVELPPDA